MENQQDAIDANCSWSERKFSGEISLLIALFHGDSADLTLPERADSRHSA
jgi:hypothetical protein